MAALKFFDASTRRNARPMSYISLRLRTKVESCGQDVLSAIGTVFRTRFPIRFTKFMLLQNKVAIVTGAATGIGQAIAIRFAKEGAAVVIDYVGDKNVPSATAQAIGRFGGKCIAIEADVSKPEQVQTLVDGAVKAFGRLDIAVNNAGVEKKFAFVDYPLLELQRILAINLVGPFLVCQAVARQLIQQGQGGRLINISSIHEDLPMPTNAAYCASKGGLRMLMRTVAVELAPHKITVNNIGPGAVYTPIDADIEAKPEIEKALMAEIPLGRWGKPDEIAGLAVFLASDGAAYVTGSTYFIDGGMLQQAGSY
jgi:glucose 1-dehydrogenase